MREYLKRNQPDYDIVTLNTRAETASKKIPNTWERIESMKKPQHAFNLSGSNSNSKMRDFVPDFKNTKELTNNYIHPYITSGNNTLRQVNENIIIPSKSSNMNRS